jgi:F-type H+-transporting ATPase subunit b
MRRSLLGIASLTAAFIAFVPGCSEKPHAGHEESPVRYKVEVHDENGKPVEKHYEMSNSADALALSVAIHEGRVIELAKDEKPDLFGLKRWDLGLWSMAIFIVLFLCLAKFAWKPMLEGLTKREEAIRSALDLAEKSRRESLEQHEKLQAQMRESAGQGAAIVDEARRNAQSVAEKLVADAKSEIQHERDRLLNEVESAKDQALQEIWKLSVSLATSMSAKAIGRSIGEDDHRRLLDESLSELKQAGVGFETRKLSGAGGI